MYKLSSILILSTFFITILCISCASDRDFDNPLDPTKTSTVKDSNNKELTKTKAILSEARSDLVGVNLGQKIFFAGGTNISGVSDIVDVYDFSLNKWSISKLIQARSSMAAASIGSKIMFAGGNKGGYSKAVDIYDEAVNTWSVKNLSQGNNMMFAATIGQFLAFTGTNYNKEVLIDVFDSTNNLWTKHSLPVSRARFAVSSIGSKIIFAGGDDSTGSYFNNVDILDLSTNEWSTSKISEARNFIANSAITIGTKVVFFGGSKNNKLSSNIDIYDSLANTWFKLYLSLERTEMAVTKVGAKVLFVGGKTIINGDYSSSAVVDIYDSLTNTTSSTTLSQARSGIIAINVGSKAIFAGGIFKSDDNSDVVDIYDSSTNTWSTAILSQARSRMCSVVFGSKVIFAGGYSKQNGFSNVIDVYDSDTDKWSTEL